MTFGIVVEGPYDKAVLEELIKKCHSENIEIISRPCGGRGPLMKRFPAYLDGFEYENAGSHVDK